MSVSLLDPPAARHPLPAEAFPERPALPPGTPLVWRAPGVLQVGFGLAISGAPRGARTALSLLDGTRPVSEAAGAAAVDRRWLEHCVGKLGRAGLLTEARPGRVTVIGEPGIRSALSGALAPRALEGCSPGVVPLHADVVVLAGGAHGANREAAAGLTARGIPHLLLGPIAGGAAVGPFVLPGQNACQRCLDLTLAERDAAWPQVAAQLESSAATPIRAAAQWATGLAATHVEAFLAGRLPESCGRTWELVDGELRVRRWPQRPDCECAGALA